VKAKAKTDALAIVKKVADTATLKTFSVVSLHADITQPPEQASGNHKFSTKITTGARALDDKSAEVLITLQVGIHRKDSEPPWALIASTVRLVYTFSARVPSNSDLQEFAKVNGVYNAWPYLREIVHSTTLRMGIPPLMLPLFRITAVPQIAASK
jgi:preprotein translocase subunit SecB